MNHLRFLRYADEVARAGSIRQAAERLHVAASAVNRRIQDIEEELGTPIFERLPRGMRLTAAGELFVRYIRGRAAELERVRSEIEELQGLRRGSVRLVASQALAPRFLPEVIRSFRETHPLVAFDVRIGDHVQAADALRSFETDLALVFNLAPEADIDRASVVEQKLMAIMHARHPLAHGGARPAPARLRRLPGGAAEPRHGRAPAAGALPGAQLDPDAGDGGEQQLRVPARLPGRPAVDLVPDGHRRGRDDRDIVARDIEDRGFPQAANWCWPACAAASCR